jgi:hypothetical protein
MAVEFAAQVVMLGLGKVAASDLIEHASKIDKAALRGRPGQYVTVANEAHVAAVMRRRETFVCNSDNLQDLPAKL